MDNGNTRIKFNPRGFSGLSRTHSTGFRIITLEEHAGLRADDTVRIKPAFFTSSSTSHEHYAQNRAYVVRTLRKYASDAPDRVTASLYDAPPIEASWLEKVADSKK
jgi:hypothetical protein